MATSAPRSARDSPWAKESTWALRADAAEAAVIHRHVRRLWLLPWTRMGRVRWPADFRSATYLSWQYWWQAHLIDCAVDAAARSPTAARRRRLARLARAPRIRNLTGWGNDYHDDMAWMALALERASRKCGGRHERGIETLTSALRSGIDAETGVLPWRRGGDFYNTPANGPAAMLFARLGDTDSATRIADWIDGTLRDERTGLVCDGVRAGEFELRYFSYCQGVVLGAEFELALRTRESRHTERIRRLVAAIAEGVCVDGVIVGDGGGDGGLFAGILARHLATIACELPDTSPGDAGTRVEAARLVLTSAEAAWGRRLDIDGEPLFGHDWTSTAIVPQSTTGHDYPGARVPERDLSVQLSGWMLMEAAARIERRGNPAATGAATARPDMDQ